jgi:hypothetical protein
MKSEMVWLPLLSKQATFELFKQVVLNQLDQKVCAFGGDCACIEGSIGSLIAKQNYFLEAMYNIQHSEMKNLTNPEIIEHYKQLFYETPKQAFNF